MDETNEINEIQIENSISDSIPDYVPKKEIEVEQPEIKQDPSCRILFGVLKNVENDLPDIKGNLDDYIMEELIYFDQINQDNKNFVDNTKPPEVRLAILRAAYFIGLWNKIKDYFKSNPMYNTCEMCYNNLIDSIQNSMSYDYVDDKYYYFVEELANSILNLLKNPTALTARKLFKRIKQTLPTKQTFNTYPFSIDGEKLFLDITNLPEFYNELVQSVNGLNITIPQVIITNEDDKNQVAEKYANAIISILTNLYELCQMPQRARIVLNQSQNDTEYVKEYVKSR